jgi:hypothetical protein
MRNVERDQAQPLHRSQGGKVSWKKKEGRNPQLILGGTR